MHDFFLWGYLKSVVYREKQNSIDELKASIVRAFDTVTVEMRLKSILEYRNRLQKCLDNNGGHVEMTVEIPFNIRLLILKDVQHYVDFNA